MEVGFKAKDKHKVYAGDKSNLARCTVLGLCFYKKNQFPEQLIAKPGLTSNTVQFPSTK